MFTVTRPVCAKSRIISLLDLRVKGFFQWAIFLRMLRRCIPQFLFPHSSCIFSSLPCHKNAFYQLIARNSGHFAPVINCQRNLISKMADKNDRSQGKRIPCDFLNNLSSVDLFYEEKSWNETPCKKMLGLYSVERLIATKQYAAVPFVTFS